MFAPITSRRNVQERRLEFVTGGVLEFWSLDNQDAARGRKYKRIIVDEAAMIPNLMDAWNFALRPTLVDYVGDAFFLSTPKGLNAFYQMYQWGQDVHQIEWASWKMPTLANPLIDEAEVEAMRVSMPERVFLQEVMAEFVDSGGGVFRRILEAATAIELDQGEPPKRYIYGCDWARHNDFTVFIVIDPQTKRMVAMDRFNQIDYSLQVLRLKALCKRFPPASIIAEENSMGGPIVERLQKEERLPVRAFMTTNATKADIIEALSLAFEQGEIEIFNDPVLIGELMAFDQERLPSGMIRYSAPQGMNDDIVIALALAWHGTRDGSAAMRQAHIHGQRSNPDRRQARRRVKQ